VQQPEVYYRSNSPCSTILIPNTFSIAGAASHLKSVGEQEKEAVAWAWPQEAGESMFHVVNTYTRAAAMEGLPADSNFKSQRVGGEVLGMLK
jgi:hypothetical protein